MGTPWHRVRLWWPVERLPVMLETVHPRKLTALEWAVLRVMDEFKDAPPTLAEVAEELGADAAFLHDTVREVVRLRALAPQSPDAQWSDLADLAFTPMGIDLFRRGRIEAEPAEHAENLYFDALTDEARPEPENAQDSTDTPFPPTAPTPGTRTDVGLDRARDMVRRFHADLLAGGGEVRSVQSRLDAPPRIVWAPTDVELYLSDQGEIVPAGPSLTAHGVEFLAGRDLLADGVLPGPSAAVSWPTGVMARRSSRVAFDQWRRNTSRTLAPTATREEVLRILGEARQEVLMHAGWYASPGVSERVGELVRRGVKVAVVGTDQSRVFAFQERPKAGLAIACTARQPMPGGIVVDGCGGLMIEDVQLRYADRRLAVALVGLLAPAAAEQVRAEFLGAFAEAVACAPERARDAARLRPAHDVDGAATRVLENDELRLAIARMAFLGDKRDLAGCVREASHLACGPERVTALARVGALARSLAYGLSEHDCSEPAREAWRELVAQLRAGGDPPSLDLLASIAPAGVEAEELVKAALDRKVTSVAGSVSRDCDLLLGVQRAADARWGPGACRAVGAWREMRDRLLSQGLGQGGDPASTLVTARRLLDAAELKVWAAAELESLPLPGDAAELQQWANRTKALANIAGDAVRTGATTHLRRILAARPEESEALLRATAGLLDLPAILEVLLPAAPTLAEILKLRRALLAAGFRGDDGIWRKRVEMALPDPKAVSTGTVAPELVRSLVNLGAESPTLASLGRNYATRIAAGIPAPATAANLASWFRELLPLRPLLDDVSSRATHHARRFADQLLAARERSDPTWSEARRAWAELGLAQSALDRLVDNATHADEMSDRRTRQEKRRR